MAEKDKKALYIVLTIFVAFIIYKVYYDHAMSNALNNSAIIIGKVEYIEYTRGSTFVHVQYPYNGKIIHGIFDSYNRETLDSLKHQTTVLLRVSKQYPAKYIEYIGVYNSFK